MIPNKVTFGVSEWTSIFEEYYSKPSYFCTKQYSKNIFRYHLFLTITMRSGFPGGSVVNNLPANAGDTREMSLIPEDPPEKEMATQSSILAWRIPQSDEPGGLLSVGLQRVGHS